MPRHHSTTRKLRAKTFARQDKGPEERSDALHEQIGKALEAIFANEEGKQDTTTVRRWDASTGKIKKLLDRILSDEDNDQALALVALVDMLTYEQDSIDREMLGIMAMNYAFTSTLAFGAVSSAFRVKALSLAA